MVSFGFSSLDTQLQRNQAPFLLDYDKWPLENKPKCPWNMVLMHTEGLVIYLQFKGVSDIRHDSQLFHIKSKTEGTMCVKCVCVCLRIGVRKVNLLWCICSTEHFWGIKASYVYSNQQFQYIWCSFWPQSIRKVVCVNEYMWVGQLEFVTTKEGNHLD